MKAKIVKLSGDLFRTKIKIEEELASGNKTNENLYQLIVKAINFLKSHRSGEPVPKKLPIFKYFEKKNWNNKFILNKN